MKKIVLIPLVLVLLISVNTKAQIESPRPSPFSTVTQKLGLTDITIEYSRPGVKDRKIFGELLPYGEWWRTGANGPTKISFGDDVIVEGNEIKAGKYTLSTIPGKEEWAIVIQESEENKTTFKVKPETRTEKTETLTIGVTDIRNNYGNVEILWENTSVKFKVEVPTKQKVEAQINAFMENPTRKLADQYFTVASYYYDEKKEMSKALELVNKAIEMRSGETPYWMLGRKAEIQAELGDYKGAIKTSGLSKVAATKAKNDGYVKSQDQNIAKWSKKK